MKFTINFFLSIKSPYKSQYNGDNSAIITFANKYCKRRRILNLDAQTGSGRVRISLPAGGPATLLHAPEESRSAFFFPYEAFFERVVRAIRGVRFGHRLHAAAEGLPPRVVNAGGGRRRR